MGQKPPAPSRPAAPRLPLVFALGVLLVPSGFWLSQRALSRGAGVGGEPVEEPRSRKSWSGVSYFDQTVVEKQPSPSRVAAGFDSERVWSGFDDWEPAVAADRTSGYVYQVAARYSFGDAQIWVRRSPDSGATWEPDFRILTDNVHQADPQVEVDGNGTVYVAFLHTPNTFLMKSYDHGSTWTDPVSLPIPPPPFVDHELLAVSEDGQDVYLAFNAGHSYVSASHDGGATFAAPVKTSSDQRQWYQTAYVITPAGEVYFAAQDFSQNYKNDAFVKILKSVDGGLSWQTYPVDVSKEAPNCNWARGCYRGFLGPTAGLARDANGVLAMVYNAGDEPGANNRIWFRTSLDGVTWSARKQLSATNRAATNAFPLVVAGQSPGDLRVVWQGGPPNGFNTWYRRTLDGGVSWGPIVKLSDLTSGAPYKWTGGYFFPYGDYFEIAVDGNDINHVIWGEGRHYIGPGGCWYTRGV